MVIMRKPYARAWYGVERRRRQLARFCIYNNIWGGGGADEGFTLFTDDAKITSLVFANDLCSYTFTNLKMQRVIGGRLQEDKAASRRPSPAEVWYVLYGILNPNLFLLVQGKRTVTPWYE